MPDATLKNVPGMATAKPVPVLEARSLSERAFKDEYVAHSRPCLIKGAVAHWPATHKWRERDYLKRICGAEQVPFWPHENHVTKKRIAPGVTNMRYADAIARLQEGRDEIGAIGCNPGTAGMWPDIAGFSFFTEGELGFSYPPFRFFIFRNAGSTWHYHAVDETLMCQVVGSKRVGLLPVDNPHYRTLCRIFLEEEDYYDDPHAFDALAGEALPWHSAELEAGDALYIPPLWWHGVVVTSDGIGVTTPVVWRSPPHVIADGLKKMAAGDFDMCGLFNIDQFRQLLEAARKIGMERELAMAWKQGVAAQQVSLIDHSGRRVADKPTWPPI
ncbi:MAG: cupin-like domain-containing protein [Alphaproteobacteria bacterium]|nr:cupin-like domain-containing protein [Alphaproteobacteria bacterium]